MWLGSKMYPQGINLNRVWFHTDGTQETLKRRVIFIIYSEKYLYLRYMASSSDLSISMRWLNFNLKSNINKPIWTFNTPRPWNINCNVYTQLKLQFIYNILLLHIQVKNVCFLWLIIHFSGIFTREGYRRKTPLSIFSDN